MKRNRILYLVLLFSSLIFIYFYGGKVPYTLFYTVLALPVVSFAYTLAAFLLFKYTQKLDRKYSVKGEKLNFIFSINNEGILFYPYVKATFFGSETIFPLQLEEKTFSISPFSKKVFSIELHCKYRGSYHVGLKTIEFEDFLGIFKFSYRTFSPEDVTVYPEIVIIETFQIENIYLPESIAPLSNSHRETSTMLDTRKYTYGDTIKSIHWKLTAKTNELMVKRYEGNSESSAALVLDLKENPYSPDKNIILEDSLIEAAVAILHYFLRNLMPVRLLYYNHGFVNTESSNMESFETFYKMLAGIRFIESMDVDNIVNVFIKNSINKCNIIILTSNISYNLYNCIYEAQTTGFNVILVFISPEEITEFHNVEEYNILSFLPEIGVRVLKINTSDNIKDILENSTRW